MSDRWESGTGDRADIPTHPIAHRLPKGTELFRRIEELALLSIGILISMLASGRARLILADDVGPSSISGSNAFPQGWIRTGAPRGGWHGRADDHLTTLWSADPDCPHTGRRPPS